MTTTFADWRAQVDKELAGASFERLVTQTPEGIAVQPLYVDGPAPDAATRAGASRFGVCVRSDAAHMAEDVDGGADSVWLRFEDFEAQRYASERGAHLIIDGPATDPRRQDIPKLQPRSEWMSWDPIDSLMAGTASDRVSEALLAIRPLMARFETTSMRGVRVSSLRAHEGGADAADELATMLSTLVVYLRHGVPAAHLWLQIAVGRDTFGELCKLRALRRCVGKVLAAVGAPDALPPIHAVCSSRTMAERDPWTNMLRGTTQIFAAALGGADLITPLPFDASPQARRVARNAALVLREESHLGRVVDPAGGSYYLESRTDALARAAWSRFQAIEAGGGIVEHVRSGALAARLAASWAARAAAIAKRKEPVLGVSEFANVDEQTPGAIAYPGHREGEQFEALRAKLAGRELEILLVQLGTPAESRARVGFAKALFATAGVRTREVTVADALAAVPHVACLCGSDDNYDANAASIAAELREAGAMRIALAGRPRELAGVTFVYMGCDVVAAIEELTR